MKLITAALFCAITLNAISQNISVKSFRLLENDMDARVNYPKKDQNGEVCAIIKVVTTQTGFDWEPDGLGIVSAERKTGEYWLYVPHGAQRLTIKHDKLGILRNYQYPVAIKSATVYVMELVTGTVETVVKEAEVVTQWLAINSTPEGASVFVEEKLVGTTPFTRKYPEGEYSYRVELPRYHNEAGKVTLKGERKTLTFSLRPKFGNLTVTSTPENGMMVYLDDENTGKVTPATLNEVSSGTHTLKLISQWYQPQARSVTVSDNQTTKTDFTMQPAFSDITIKTEPNADIVVDGTKKGNGTFSARMLEGVYTIKAERDKHHPDQKQLTVIAGTPQTVTLNPKPQTGTLDVTSTPFDATITIDGKNYGTTPNTIKDLLVGSYTLTLTKPNYGSVVKTVTIEEGKTTEVNETLPIGMEVTIASTPTGAKLWVNGVAVGTTPYKTTLGFGNHRVKLENGGEVVEETIAVSSERLSQNLWDFNVLEDTKKAKVVDTPCSDSEFPTTRSLFRGTGMGESTNLSAARRKAKLDANAMLASTINQTINTAIDRYANEAKIDNVSQFTANFNKIAITVVNQLLSNVSTVCDKTFKRKDKYAVYAAVEVSKQELINNLTSQISRDDRLRLDYDRVKFETILNSEIDKLVN